MNNSCCHQENTIHEDPPTRRFLSTDKTSLHGHGLQDLVDAIGSAPYKVAWLESPKEKESPRGIDRMLKISNRFHTAARQIKR